jgi:hypothetical protein
LEKLLQTYNLRASRIARVVGQDKYCSRQNYFAILKGEKEEPPINEEFTEHGNFCEPYGVAAVMADRGCWVDSFGKEQKNFCLQDYMKENETKIELSCTPDGIIKDLNCLCEIKSPFYEVEDTQTYAIKYYPQMQFQLYVANSLGNNYNGVFLCIYQKENTKIFYVPINKDYSDNFMIPKVEEFSKYLIKGQLDKIFKTKRNSPKDFEYKGEMLIQKSEKATPC